MNFIGIDLHKRFLVACVKNSEGAAIAQEQILCQDVGGIEEFFAGHSPFSAVLEASSSSRWLYELLRDKGQVVVAHPYRLRAIVSGRAKTDKNDAAMLADLLRAGLVPLSHVPERPIYELRELTRARARLSMDFTKAKNELHAILTRANIKLPFRCIDSRGAQRFVAQLDLGVAGNFMRSELLSRFEHYESKMLAIDEQLATIAQDFPQIDALMDIHGVGKYFAMLIIAEISDPSRFKSGRQVGSYAGLTPRVSQSGDSCYHGSISRQGSPWLRWALVQIAMKAPARDQKLANMYLRIRKRSSAKKARVAVARKLAEICWVRLKRWERQQVA